MRIASIDGLETGAMNDKTKKVNELVKAPADLITKEGDIVFASDSKLKLWRESVCPIKANIIGADSAESIKALSRRIRWRDRCSISTRSPTCGRSR